MSNNLCRALRLYLVLDPSMCLLNPLDIAAASIRGGATAIQLRVKTLTDRETVGFAKALRQACGEHDVLFLVNDRLDIALASDAHGVHLGVDDLPLEYARSIGGPDFILGYSPETDDQARAARAAGASYLGVGPVYGTASKADAGPAIGLELLETRQRISGLPTIGIGGIDAGNAAAIVETGACGVAVMSAITRSSDPETATRDLKKALARSQP